MNQTINTLNYDLNRMSAVDLISVIHIDDYNTRFIELALSDQGSPFSVAGSTVIARFVTADGVLLNDNVSCTVTEDGNILIPIDAAAVNSVACDLKIEVNITQGTDVLTLPFPLWVRVRGSILETSGISPESQGTIPDLLHQVEEELQRVQGFTDEDEVYEILDNTLSGNRNISPTLLVDNIADQTYNPDGDLILYYIDSDDIRHNVFDFTPYLENYVSSAVVNQNGTITFTLDDGSTFTTTGSSVIGSDGFSPTVSTTSEYLRTRVEITDVNGTQYFYINDGESVKSAVIDANGDLIITIKGKPTSGVRPTYPERIYNVGHVVGADGYSPTATVTQTQNGATVSITDKNGTTTANISNGNDYVLTAQDKSDIADLVLAELPTTQGVQYGNTGN